VTVVMQKNNYKKKNEYLHNIFIYFNKTVGRYSLPTAFTFGATPSHQTDVNRPLKSFQGITMTETDRRCSY